LSRVRGPVTHNNEFWIGRLDLLTPSFAASLKQNQLQQLTINGCLRLTPFWLEYDSLLFQSSFHCDWLGSDSRITHFCFTNEFGMKNESWITAHVRLNHEWMRSRVESYATTDGQSASLSRNKAPIWGLRPDFHYCQTVADLLMSGAVSDERTGLTFTNAARPLQRSDSRVRVPWDSRQYFTDSDLGLPFLSPPTTRRATVEAFDHASTREIWTAAYIV
jgi:hypothetical protein